MLRYLNQKPGWKIKYARKILYVKTWIGAADSESTIQWYLNPSSVLELDVIVYSEGDQRKLLLWANNQKSLFDCIAPEVWRSRKHCLHLSSVFVYEFCFKRFFLKQFNAAFPCFHLKKSLKKLQRYTPKWTPAAFITRVIYLHDFNASIENGENVLKAIFFFFGFYSARE